MNEYLNEILGEGFEEEELFYQVTDHAIEREMEQGMEELEDYEKK
ncbi:MAG: hypothetical protein K0S47_4219 [Herbinix sp.]|jgi:hypothetical protein|nr:hypothetical protein [Herbinix sp.]